MENSRERIRKTINHHQPDGLVIDFGSTTSSGISIFAYAELKKHLGFDKCQDPKIFDIFLMLADPSEKMLSRMGGDIVQLKRLAPNFGIRLENWKPWTLHNGIKTMVPGDFCPVQSSSGLELLDHQRRVLARMPDDGYYFDYVLAPYKHIETVAEIDELELGGISNEELDYLEREGHRLFVETEKAIVFSFSGRVLEAGIQGWGFEEFLVQMMTNDDMVHRYFERITDIYIQDMDKILARCNGYIDIFRFVDDLGSQNSLLLSPALYRELVKPYHKKIYQHVKVNYPKQKTAMHCCGSIKPLIPDLIEAGIDILNPVQISASNMDPLTLKKEYGKDIVFWGGGADMQFNVVNGTIDEIKSDVDRLINIFAPDGGFIFNPVHNIQANVTPEKILAIYDTALKYQTV